MMRRISFFCVILAAQLAIFVGGASAQDTNSSKPAQASTPNSAAKPAWADELIYHQWRIQRNAVDGRCQLLNGRNRQLALGTFDECRNVLQQCRTRQPLPMVNRHAVVVLHGLGADGGLMASLCSYIERKGGYMAVNVEYPSMQDDIASHARSLHRVIDHLEGVKQIDFVAHSMGNIVIRHYLGDLAKEASGDPSTDSAKSAQKTLAMFHRFVMIGPPNHGSSLAATLGNNSLFRNLAGQAGQDIGRDWPNEEKRLVTPPFEFGIIAGGMNNDLGFNPLIPGDNDFTLSVQTTQLAGAADFIIVPVLHHIQPKDANIQKYTLSFLQRGYFVSTEQRHHIPSEQ
jgi:pimeloyl-ACP methyl ester carboxylesterase